MRTVLLFATAALAAATAAAQASDQSIPDSFHGLWQPIEAGASPSCAGHDSDIRIRINATTVDLHEGQCVVRELSHENEGSLRVRSDCGQEDSAWAADEQWSLSDDADGPQLIISGHSSTAGDYRYRYGHCPE